MPPHVDLIGDCKWICDVIADLRKTLKNAGYEHTPSLLEECQSALLTESCNLQETRRQTPIESSANTQWYTL